MPENPPQDSQESIVEGVSIDANGVVHADSALEQALCDLAIDLQEFGHAVDVEHVLAALVMSVREGKLRRGIPLAELDVSDLQQLHAYIDQLFRQYGGRVTADDQQDESPPGEER